MGSNTTNTEFLNILDDREGQNYKENERANRPTGEYLGKLEQILYKKTERGRKDNQPLDTIALMVIK